MLEREREWTEEAIKSVSCPMGGRIGRLDESKAEHFGGFVLVEKLPLTFV